MSTILTEEQTRGLARSWDRREERVNKRLYDRKRYLSHHVEELRERIDGGEFNIGRLHTAILGDVSMVLYRPDDDLDADCEAGGEPAGARGASGGQVCTFSMFDAQRVRLYNQAMTTLEVLL